MNKKDKYIIAFDVSLSQTGACIFDEKGNPVKLFSIPTSSKLEHGERLKIIADYLIDIRNKYSINTIVLEAGFSRYNRSTQAIFKSLGIVNYIFYNCFQKEYSPSTIKKIACGKGNADKKQVQDKMKTIFPNLTFSCFDESDACAVGYAFFLDKRNGNG